MEKQPLTLRERQLEYLRILKELDQYCTENNLRYYMGCGTLIGAVRHKGFIPWDDDLDVFMPQPDFDRFWKEYQPGRFIIRTIYNDLSHPFTFGRFCDTSVYSFTNNQKIYDCGIDIYVINGAPSERNEQIEHIDKVFKFINRKSKLASFRNILAKRGLWPNKSLNFKLLNRTLKRADAEFRKYKFDDCKYIWPYGGGKLILKKELYGIPVRLQFEDGCFYAPEHYHEVLTAGYGDYMTLPPEDKRKPYHGVTCFWNN